MKLRNVVKEANGTLEWDEDSKTATVKLNKITKSYNISNCVVENDHIMVDSAQVAEDFNMNASEVEARHTRAQTGAYLSSDQAITAYKQTGISIVTCTGAAAINPVAASVQLVGGVVYEYYQHVAGSSVFRLGSPSTPITMLGVFKYLSHK
jgi:hypothetical protein